MEQEIARINIDNLRAEEFRLIGNPPEIEVAGGFYCSINPDINELQDIILSEADQFVLCPENGKWRGAAIFSLKGGKVAIFFPMIFPDLTHEFKLGRPMAVGVNGEAKQEDAEEACRNILGAFAFSEA